MSETLEALDPATTTSTARKETSLTFSICLKQIITIVYFLESFKEKPILNLDNFYATQIFIHQIISQDNFIVSPECPEGSSDLLKNLAEISISSEEIGSMESPEEDRITELVENVSRILSQHSKTIRQIKSDDLGYRIFDEISFREITRVSRQ